MECFWQTGLFFSKKQKNKKQKNKKIQIKKKQKMQIKALHESNPC
jgi:hypothetical protein